MVNKKGYMKTVEAIIGIVLVLVVLSFVLSQNTFKHNDPDLDVLFKLQDSQQFRNCVADRNTTCATELISHEIPDKYNFKVQLDNEKPSLPSTDVFVEQYYMAGTISNYDPTVIKLYYW